jgi:hypothetical protein
MTYSSGYTASKIRCCSIFDPERKFIAANRKICQTVFRCIRRSPTPYTPSPGSERNWCPDVNLLDKQGYESSDIERGDTVPQDAKSLEEGSMWSSVL